MDLQQLQPDIPQEAFESPPNNNKKIWLYISIGIVIIFLAAAGYQYYYGLPLIDSTPLAPIQGVETEGEEIGKDLTELESFNEDKLLDTLDQDLTRASGEQVVIETVSVENFEKELSDELNALSADLTNLESFNSDTSLDNLESGLTSAVQ